MVRVRESGFGEPLIGEDGDAGFGEPLEDGTGGEAGFGSPLLHAGDLAMELRRPFSTYSENLRRGFDPAYAEDGGDLVEVEADWPIAGPYTVRVRNQDGVLIPSGIGEGLSAAVPGQGSAIYADGSRRRIRFALPKLVRGVYDLVVTWEDGAQYAEQARALRIVPRRVPWHAEGVLRDFGTAARIERTKAEMRGAG